MALVLVTHLTGMSFDFHVHGFVRRRKTWDTAVESLLITASQEIPQGLGDQLMIGMFLRRRRIH